MKTTATTEKKACTCQFCQAKIYTVALLARALSISTTDEEICHNILIPISKLVIPAKRFRGNLEMYFDDARAVSLSNLYFYYRKHALEATERCLFTLIRVAKSGVSYIMREYNKHDRAASSTAERATEADTHEQKRIIGRRVYATEHADANFDEDSFTLLIDKLQANTSAEDSYVNRIDARNAIMRILETTNPKAIKQAVANLTLRLSIFDAFDENVIPTHILITKIREEVDPLANDICVTPDVLDTFFLQSEKVIGPLVDLQRLRTKAYNNGKSNVLNTVANGNIVKDDAIKTL